MISAVAKELLYSDFLADPTCAYYYLDCGYVAVLVDGEKQLGVIITAFALDRLKHFWADSKRVCNVIEIDFIDVIQNPARIVSTLESGSYVYVTGDELREKEMCAAPITDLDYILLC